MGRKRNSKSNASSRFKVASSATAPSSAQDAPNIESLVATLRTPDELEKRSWQAAITVKKATIWMLVATVAILIVTIALPFAVEFFKARVGDAQARPAGGEPKQDQRSNVERSTASPASSEILTNPTAKISDPKSSSVGSEKALASETDPNSSLVASYLRQARAQYRQNNYSKALAACETALKLDPHNQTAIALRIEIRDTAQAMSDNDKQRP